MPYLFIPDGAPEADEYASNYVWCDPTDPASLRVALDELAQRSGKEHGVADPIERPGRRLDFRLRTRA
jgi:hypothetical protein